MKVFKVHLIMPILLSRKCKLQPSKWINYSLEENERYQLVENSMIPLAKLLSQGASGWYLAIARRKKIINCSTSYCSVIQQVCVEYQLYAKHCSWSWLAIGNLRDKVTALRALKCYKMAKIWNHRGSVIHLL